MKTAATTQLAKTTRSYEAIATALATAEGTDRDDLLAHLSELDETRLGGVLAAAGVQHREHTASAEMQKALGKTYATAARKHQATADAIERNLRHLMDAIQMDRVAAGPFVFQLQNTGGPRAVEITDPDAVPEAFTTTKTVTSVDKEAVRKHLATLPGQKNEWAKLRRSTLKVRIK